jgi:hypothetical protein
VNENHMRCPVRARARACVVHRSDTQAACESVARRRLSTYSTSSFHRVFGRQARSPMAANGQAAPADKSPFSNFIDHDGEMRLDFEEFIEMQPVKIREIHTREQMLQWFKDADGNGDGKLSINEFFTCARLRPSNSFEHSPIPPFSVQAVGLTSNLRFLHVLLLCWYVCRVAQQLQGGWSVGP